MGRQQDHIDLANSANALTFEQFHEVASEFDDAVCSAPVADRFCSGSPWILSAVEAFSECVSPFMMRQPVGWAPLMIMDTVLGRTVLPLEASWGLAAPFIGRDLRAVAREFASFARVHRSRWDAMFLSGLTRGAPDFTTMVHHMGRHYRLGLGRATVRCVADISDGVDGFLSRRTRKFRKNLRRACRMANGRLTFSMNTAHNEADARELFATIIDIERRSWKGDGGPGIDGGPMNTFYDGMVPRLAARGELRVTFARSADDGSYIGYVLGGLRGTTYRGLQISYDAAFSSLSVGNLMQFHTIRMLCEEGIRAYDLGTDMDYKRGWAEQMLETVPLVVR